MTARRPVGPASDRCRRCRREGRSRWPPQQRTPGVPRRPGRLAGLLGEPGWAGGFQCTHAGGLSRCAHSSRCSSGWPTRRRRRNSAASRSRNACVAPAPRNRGAGSSSSTNSIAPHPSAAGPVRHRHRRPRSLSARPPITLPNHRCDVRSCATSAPRRVPGSHRPNRQRPLHRLPPTPTGRHRRRRINQAPGRTASASQISGVSDTIEVSSDHDHVVKATGSGDPGETALPVWRSRRYSVTACGRRAVPGRWRRAWPSRAVPRPAGPPPLPVGAAGAIRGRRLTGQLHLLDSQRQQPRGPSSSSRCQARQSTPA